MRGTPLVPSRMLCWSCPGMMMADGIYIPFAWPLSRADTCVCLPFCKSLPLRSQPQPALTVHLSWIDREIDFCGGTATGAQVRASSTTMAKGIPSSLFFVRVIIDSHGMLVRTALISEIPRYWLC